MTEVEFLVENKILMLIQKNFKKNWGHSPYKFEPPLEMISKQLQITKL